jgi:hypothetical protein
MTNMTLMEKERNMLSGVRLGHEFWAEAANIASYLVNRLPSCFYATTTIPLLKPLHVMLPSEKLGVHSPLHYNSPEFCPTAVSVSSPLLLSRL